MRKIILILIPVLLAIATFFIIIFILSLNKDKGAVQITSIPNSAVYINDKYSGKTPFCKCDAKDMLNQGTYTIKLIPENGNFNQFEEKININPHVLTVVDKTFAENGFDSASIISLLSIDDKKDAQISVVTIPASAQIYLDSNLQGQSPVLLKNNTESDHELKISKDGYLDKIVRIRAILGFKLQAIVYLGLNSNNASNSASISMPEQLPASDSAKLNTPKIKILTTPTGFLRVRKEPMITSVEIGRVKPGDELEFIDEKTDWIQIKLSNGITGWVSSQYIQKI